ncbi:MAG TPA: PfkB family carbohydrate kinase [Gaiellaceae bacterium]|nr:PfkB family carbohydrate kinase [Gaiellaceae bacterium]
MSAAVVCVGLATLDHIAAVSRQPAPDELVFATDFAVAGGGPAATAAVTLARLGVETAFVGAVGDDDVGAVIRDGLAREGVDVSELRVVPGARSPQSAIFVGGGLRTIAAFRGGGLPPLELSPRARDLCLAAAWVHVDQTGYGAAVPLRGRIRLSVDGGNPIDGLDLRDVALYAPTESALRDGFGGPAAALEAGAELVVVTRGAEGSVAYGRGGEVVEAPGETVAVVSTLGAGDVFHGALLARLVAGAALPDALTFANRCAARSCRALDGRSGIPTAAELAS